MDNKKMVRWLLFVSLLIFAASFFLPAYKAQNATYPGWFCAYFCFLWPLEERFNEWQTFYYSAFNLSNLFMIIVPLFFVVRRVWHVHLLLRIAQVLLLFHVISWLVFDRIENGEILIGYYVWLFSMVLALLVLQLGRGRWQTDDGGQMTDDGRQGPEDGDSHRRPAGYGVPRRARIRRQRTGDSRLR